MLGRDFAKNNKWASMRISGQKSFFSVFINYFLGIANPDKTIAVEVNLSNVATVITILYYNCSNTLYNSHICLSVGMEII